jgi:ribosomal protein S18 acetylase RimI-like enzyme
MLYRLYQPGDFAALYAVEELCFEPPFRFSRALMRKLIANPNSAAWIAEENGKLASFAIVDWATVPKGTVAYIQTIEVHPESRRRTPQPRRRLRPRRRSNRHLAPCRR